MNHHVWMVLNLITNKVCRNQNCLTSSQMLLLSCSHFERNNATPLVPTGPLLCVLVGVNFLQQPARAETCKGAFLIWSTNKKLIK